MDLEKLTKHQIVLLTLLVSFVTAIATGIVTVSLMNQAPPNVVKTINQIVERTVEKVVTPPPVANQSAVVTTTQKTVVIKDDDLAAQSIANVQKAIVRIVAKNDPTMLLARGVIVDGKGTTLTDRGALAASADTAFFAFLASGEKVPVKIVSMSSTSPIAVLELAVGTSTGFAPVPLGDISKVKLGTSVIRIGGTGADTVGMGVVASLPDAHASLIQASVSSATPGSVLTTLFGEVIGIMTSDSGAQGVDLYSTPFAAKAPSIQSATQER